MIKTAVLLNIFGGNCDTVQYQKQTKSNWMKTFIQLGYIKQTISC